MKLNIISRMLFMLLLLALNSNLIFSMEEQPQSSSDDESGEEERSIKIKTPKPLAELVGRQIAKKAAQVYDEQGYVAFENYLNRLPEHVKIEILFCKLINYLDRADIFIARLKEIYKVSQENAFKYFSEFCENGQKTILEKLLEERILDKDLIKYLINNITNLEILDYLYSFLPDVKGKKKPRLSQKARERLRAFKDQISYILRKKFEKIIKNVHVKQVEVNFSDEIEKMSDELLNAGGLVFENPSPENTSRLQNVLSRFRLLDKKEQIEVFQFIFLIHAIQAKPTYDLALFILRDYVMWDQLDASDNKAIQNAIDIHFEILNKLDEVYPEMKKFRNYAIGENYMDTLMLPGLLQDNIFLGHKLLVRLLKESKINQALSLLRNMQDRAARFQSPQKAIFAEDSILLNLFEYLPFEESISQEEAAIYYKNLYEFFKKSVENIKAEFKKLIPSEGERESKIFDWIGALKDWFKNYVEELKERNLASDEEIKNLTEDFKKEVLEKFESSN